MPNHILGLTDLCVCTHNFLIQSDLRIRSIFMGLIF